ncbi:NDP-sugar synthase [Paenibacillus sp. JTLBN-2024]
MNVLLLAGGLGTRLRPMTENMPKPMAPILNRPWLEHLILHLKEQGVHRFVIALKHHPEKIRNHFGDGRRLGVSDPVRDAKTSCWERPGRSKTPPSLCSDEQFIAMNADIVHDIELKLLLDFHRSHGRKGHHRPGREVEDPSAYGVVDQDDITGRHLAFCGEALLDEALRDGSTQAFTSWKKACSQRFRPIGKSPLNVKRLSLLIRENMGVFGTTIQGYWADMGTKDRYRQVHWDLLNGAGRIRMPGQAQDQGIWIGKGCKIGAGVLLVPPVLIGGSRGNRCPGRHRTSCGARRQVLGSARTSAESENDPVWTAAG